MSLYAFFLIPLCLLAYVLMSELKRSLNLRRQAATTIKEAMKMRY